MSSIRGYNVPLLGGGTTGDSALNVSSGGGDDAELRQLQKLCMAYRLENGRLRDQLKAQNLRETYMIGRMQQHCRTPAASSTSCGASPSETEEVGVCIPTHQEQLAAKTERIQELEAQVSVLQGRVEGYALAFQQGQTRSSSSQQASSPQPAGKATNSVVEDDTHALLCQCLSCMEYLVKVFNAVEHCRKVPHPQLCPRSLQACRTRCLQAAMKGNTEDPADILARGHNVAHRDLLLSLREVLEYCETTSVRLAACMLSEVTAAQMPTKQRLATPEEEEERRAASPRKAFARVDTTRLDASLSIAAECSDCCSDEAERGPTCVGTDAPVKGKKEEADPDSGAEQLTNGTRPASPPEVTPEAVRRRGTPQPRPELQDCQVQ